MPGNRSHHCQNRELSVPQAFVVALLIESLFTVAALRYSGQHQPRPVIPQPVPFTVTVSPLPPAPVHKPKPAPKKPAVRPKPAPKPKPKPKPAPKPKPKPVHKPKPKPRPKPKPKPKPVPKPVPKPKPVRHRTRVQPKVAPPKAPARTAPVPRTPPPAVSAKPSPKALARMTVSFKDAVRSAVKSAVRYPRAAQAMGIEGATEVAFEYHDGQARQVRVVHSSGSPILDQAALNAVRESSLPAPPAALKGHTLRFRIWLRFHFNGQG